MLLRCLRCSIAGFLLFYMFSIIISCATAPPPTPQELSAYENRYKGMDRVQLIKIFEENYVGKKKFDENDWYRVVAVKRDRFKVYRRHFGDTYWVEFNREWSLGKKMTTSISGKSEVDDSWIDFLNIEPRELRLDLYSLLRAIAGTYDSRF
jgi:hypothetical protein